MTLPTIKGPNQIVITSNTLGASVDTKTTATKKEKKAALRIR